MPGTRGLQGITEPGRDACRVALNQWVEVTGTQISPPNRKNVLTGWSRPVVKPAAQQADCPWKIPAKETTCSTGGDPPPGMEGWGGGGLDDLQGNSGPGSAGRPRSPYHAGQLVCLHFPDIYNRHPQASKRDEERSVADRKPIPSEEFITRRGMEGDVLNLRPTNPSEPYALEGYVHLCTFLKRAG